MILDAPTSYRHWTGRHGVVKEPGYPMVRMEERDGIWWIEWIPDNESWGPVGYYPRGRTPWRVFWRHWHHGRLMGYPRMSVLAFAWKPARA